MLYSLDIAAHCGYQPQLSGVDGDPLPKWQVKRWGESVRIEDFQRQSVFFFGVLDANGRFMPKATGFFIYVEKDGFYFTYMVTAEHVISGLQTRGYERLFMRLNLEAGGSQIFEAGYDHWQFHSGGDKLSDVAVAPCRSGLLNSTAHLAIPIEQYWSPDVETAPNLGLGDVVSIIGLFRSHFGRERNLPVVRTGNLASLPEEPVYTKYAGYIDAYLIEARSIGGLSGSPVFIHRPVAWVSDDDKQKRPLFRDGAGMILMGLMQGHYDVKNVAIDVEGEVSGDGDEVAGSVNTGIGVVVPADKIRDIIYGDVLTEQRERAIASKKDQEGATSDIAPEEQEQDATGDNPQHKEDFSRLLNAAASDRKEEPET